MVQRKVDEQQGTKAQVFAADDGPELLEGGLWRIPVPLPFALRSANIYLLADGPDDWTLVDAGLGLPADEAALRSGLAFAGIALEQITALILTHSHPDHVGLAGPIQAASGVPVYMLAGEEQTMYRVWSDQVTEVAVALGEMYAAHGMTPEQVNVGQRNNQRISAILKLPPAESIVTLEDGEELRLGRHTYRTIWTPGHADWHLCLLRDDGLFIAGDHILPGITPNIGRYPHGRANPLGDYFWALTRVHDLSVRLVLPGHRRPFTALAERVDALRQHHEERSQQIAALLVAAPAGLNALAVARLLFGERLQNDDDLRFALAESLAHLDYLCTEGHAIRHEEGGHIHYTAAGL